MWCDLTSHLSSLITCQSYLSRRWRRLPWPCNYLNHTPPPHPPRPQDCLKFHMPKPHDTLVHPSLKLHQNLCDATLRHSCVSVYLGVDEDSRDAVIIIPLHPNASLIPPPPPPPNAHTPKSPPIPVRVPNARNNYDVVAPPPLKMTSNPFTKRHCITDYASVVPPLALTKTVLTLEAAILKWAQSEVRSEEHEAAEDHHHHGDAQKPDPRRRLPLVWGTLLLADSGWQSLLQTAQHRPCYCENISHAHRSCQTAK